MTATIDITQSQLYTDVGNFVVSMLGIAGAALVQGYPNRVAMPAPSGLQFVEMHNSRMVRLNTNVDTWDQTNPDPSLMTQTAAWQVSMQFSLYGSAAGDWASILATLFRDEVACNALTTCQPLYADDPIRAPLIDAEEQYEDKWIVIAQLQYNPTVSTAQQFANVLALDVVNVDEAYPP
jgi:hypothetical protein